MLLGTAPSSSANSGGTESGNSTPLLYVGAQATVNLHPVPKEGAPRAYLKYIFFDKNGLYHSSDYDTAPASANVIGSSRAWQPLSVGFTAPEDGYVQVLVANESEAPVWFDDLQVTVTGTMIVQENHYSPWGLNLVGIEKQGSPDDKFQYNGKEKQEELGLNWLDYGARMYDPQLGRWHVVDAESEKMTDYSPYSFAFNNPLVFLDRDGNWAVKVHYIITAMVLKGYGYDVNTVDKLSHYASTYADSPALWVLKRFNPGEAYKYRTNSNIAYYETRDSQEEYNSHWHSMMSDEEFNKGMTHEEAMLRGMGWGWSQVFEAADLSTSSNDADGNFNHYGKLGQGLHALQDGYAHHGAATHEHVGVNLSSFNMLHRDMSPIENFDDVSKSIDITNSAMLVYSIMTGNSKTVDSMIKNGQNSIDAKGMTNTHLINLIQKVDRSNRKLRYDWDTKKYVVE